MFFSLEVENIKCGGCAHTIETKLAALAGVTQVTVDVAAGLVTFESEAASSGETVASTLASIGYPQKGSVKGLEAVGAKAKSFVSCAIGKVSQE
ncbi:MAG: heavy-metal-associated domain-containing protein [Hydrogenovibrio sp.]